MIPKLRAWDKELKMMCDVLKIDFGNRTLFYRHWLYGVSREIDLSEVIVMQSTTLKDKNNVEIYEGDIIDKGYLSNVHDEVGVVTFGKGVDSDGFYAEGWLGWITDKGSSVLDVHKKCKVLGNIYENPELLEDE